MPGRTTSQRLLHAKSHFFWEIVARNQLFHTDGGSPVKSGPNYRFCMEDWSSAGIPISAPSWPLRAARTQAAGPVLAAQPHCPGADSGARPPAARCSQHSAPGGSLVSARLPWPRGPPVSQAPGLLGATGSRRQLSLRLGESHMSQAKSEHGEMSPKSYKSKVLKADTKAEQRGEIIKTHKPATPKSAGLVLG